MDQPPYKPQFFAQFWLSHEFNGVGQDGHSGFFCSWCFVLQDEWYLSAAAERDRISVTESFIDKNKSQISGKWVHGKWRIVGNGVHVAVVPNVSYKTWLCRFNLETYGRALVPALPPELHIMDSSLSKYVFITCVILHRVPGSTYESSLQESDGIQSPTFKFCVCVDRSSALSPTLWFHRY